MTPKQPACPSCGANVGGRSGCQELFEQIIARAWESPSRGSVHNLVVDAYALQHTEEYGKSAKSFVAHLVQLCCGVESPGDKELYRAVARWLDGPVRLTRPHDVHHRGAMTIADIHAFSIEGDYPAVVRQWALDVWNAYSDQHVTVMEWLAEVRSRPRRMVLH